MKSEELESGFTPSRILFKWGIWDEKEREWQRESEFIKSNIILMFKVNVFSEPCDLGHFPQETFHLNAKIQFLLNNELLNIGTILFQPYFPTACTKNTWSIYVLHFLLIVRLKDFVGRSVNCQENCWRVILKFSF